MAARTKKPRRGRPPTGKAMTAVERMRLMRARRKAVGLKPVVSWVPREPGHGSVYSPHRLLDARSLAMHAAIAAKISRDPKLLAIPRRNLDRWSVRWGNDAPAWLLEWRGILIRPWTSIAAFITEPSEEATRLRQSSPFAGVLTQLERKRIYEAFRA